MFTSNGRLIIHRELLLDKKVILLILKIYLKGFIVEIKTTENEHNFKLIKQKKNVSINRSKTRIYFI